MLFRPWYIKTAQQAGSALEKIGAINTTTEADRLHEIASRNIGYEDFGPANYEDALAILIESYKRDGDLNFIGRMSAKAYMQQLLEARLVIEHDRHTHPEIAQEAIQRPVFILGLPRTGSTALFEMIESSGDYRAPATSEVTSPSPVYYSEQKRRTISEQRLQWVDRLSPEFKKIHPMGPELPQECICIQAMAFRSIQFHTSHRVNQYHQWLTESDWSPAYDYHKRFLQNLQFFDRYFENAQSQQSRRWLLKAPAHLFSIESLLETYPDALIVQTHRAPSEVIGSIVSLVLSLRQAFSDTLDVEEAASDWSNQWHQALLNTIEFRSNHPELESRFLDVYYQDFISNPVTVCERIQKFVDLPVDDQRLQTWKHLITNRPQNRFGKHEYRLEDFGLSVDSVNRLFADYREHYGV